LRRWIRDSRLQAIVVVLAAGEIVMVLLVVFPIGCLTYFTAVVPANQGNMPSYTEDSSEHHFLKVFPLPYDVMRSGSTELAAHFNSLWSTESELS
jgi:hypothetical protein